MTHLRVKEMQRKNFFTGFFLGGVVKWLSKTMGGTMIHNPRKPAREEGGSPLGKWRESNKNYWDMNANKWRRRAGGRSSLCE